MIMSDAEPIGNRSPLPPIDLHPPRQQTEEDYLEPAMSICQAVEASLRATAAKLEADRVWKLVVQSAEAGSPVAAPAAESLPTVDAVYPGPATNVYVSLHTSGDDDESPSPYEMDVWVDTAPSEYCAGLVVSPSPELVDMVDRLKRYTFGGVLIEDTAPCEYVAPTEDVG